MNKALFIASLVILSSPLWAAEWFEVEKADYPITMETTGTVVSTKVVKFDPPVSRRWQTQITDLAREGQYVKKGDLLIRFESSYEERKLRDFRSELEEKQGELEAFIQTQTQEKETEKLNLAAAESQLDKSKRKADQPENLIASIEYEKLLKERELAEQLVKQLRQRAVVSEDVRSKRLQALEMAVKRHQGMFDMAKKQFDSYTIHAPHEGLVVVGTDYSGDKLDVNSQVHPGLVVISLVDASSFEVEATAPEHESAQLRAGQRVNLIADSIGGLEISGEIKSVGRTVRRKSRRSFEMVRDFVITLDEQPDNLTLGTTLRAIVELGIMNDAVAIPLEAVSYRDGLPGVQVREGWRLVQLGATSVNQVLIESGLRVGEEVLL